MGECREAHRHWVLSANCCDGTLQQGVAATVSAMGQHVGKSVHAIKII